MTEDELARRRASRTGTVPAQVTERDYPHHTLHVDGVTYEVSSGITAEDITGLVEWVEEIAEGLRWGVMYIGENEGPELHEVWGRTSVWITSGQVRAVLHAGAERVAPILLGANAADGTAHMLIEAHCHAMNALNRASDFR